MNYAWLAERKTLEYAFESGSEYLHLKNGRLSWTANSHAALHLSRKEDAEALIDQFDLRGAYPAQHGWG